MSLATDMIAKLERAQTILVDLTEDAIDLQRTFSIIFPPMVQGRIGDAFNLLDKTKKTLKNIANF